MNSVKSIISRSPEETILIGKDYAKKLDEKNVVGLFGNLGSGKTQFVKGICEYFHVDDNVNSPTFIIVNEYKGADDSNKQVNISHFDLFRLKDIKELFEIGFEDYLNGKFICLIEWAQVAEKYLKGNMKKVYFEYGTNENERIIKILD